LPGDSLLPLSNQYRENTKIPKTEGGQKVMNMTRLAAIEMCVSVD